MSFMRVLHDSAVPEIWATYGEGIMSSLQTLETPETLEAPAHDDASAEWHRICPDSELEPMWGEAALIGSAQIAVVKLAEDQIYAVDHWDPVAQANVMARGIIGSKQGNPTLASPIHKQVYDLTTGECLSEDGPELGTYPVRVVDGTVEIQL